LQPNILVVDDDGDVRALAVSMIELLGHPVVAAEGGAEALAALARHPSIRLLFTDVLMPGMSGYALARAALALRPDLSVLMTTGYLGGEEPDEADLAALPVLRKPYRLAQLEPILRQLLDDRE